MFGPKMYVCEAPLALLGMAVGGLTGAGIIGGAGILGGGLVGGLAGAALGGVTATLLGKALKPPKVKGAQSQERQAAAETPALPPAAPMPAAPLTPVAGPAAPGILQPSDTIAPDIPKVDRPQVPAEASPPTTEEIARGQLEKKRKGRLSTILTSPKSRLDATDEDEGFERLGG